jgi:hypothetical protein
MPSHSRSTKSAGTNTTQLVAAPDGSTISKELDSNVHSRPSSEHNSNKCNMKKEQIDDDSNDEIEWKTVLHILFHPENSITPIEAWDYNYSCNKGYNISVN